MAHAAEHERSGCFRWKKLEWKHQYLWDRFLSLTNWMVCRDWTKSKWRKPTCCTTLFMCSLHLHVLWPKVQVTLKQIVPRTQLRARGKKKCYYSFVIFLENQCQFINITNNYNIYIYVCVYMCICVQVYVCIYIYMYIYIYIYTYLYLCMFVSLHVYIIYFAQLIMNA